VAGHFILQTDARDVDERGPAAIGAVLRQRVRGKFVVVDFLSHTIERRSGSAEPVTVGIAEYLALIAGLELAKKHNATTVRAYVDSEIMADEVNKEAPDLKAQFTSLHRRVRRLMKGFDVKISWLPREMNSEADQRVRDALIRHRRVIRR
jgi:ribonuclease HI